MTDSLIVDSNSNNQVNPVMLYDAKPSMWPGPGKYQLHPPSTLANRGIVGQ